MKHRWAITAAIAVISFFSGGWLLQRGTGDQAVFRQARIFDDGLNHVRHFYVDSVPEADLYKKASADLSADARALVGACQANRPADIEKATSTLHSRYEGLGKIFE